MKEITEEATMKKITAETEEWEEQPAQPDSWVFAMRDRQREILNARSWRSGPQAGDYEDSLILVDSGSDEHMCGYSFAPLAPTRESTNYVTMRDAQGNMIKHDHQRDVSVRMKSSRGSVAEATATFEVADVKCDSLRRQVGPEGFPAHFVTERQLP